MMRLCRPRMMSPRFTESMDPVRAKTKACRDLKDYKEKGKSNGRRIESFVLQMII
jgi:hypothetical protein